MQKRDFLESMLSNGAFQEKAILFFKSVSLASWLTKSHDQPGRARALGCFLYDTTWSASTVIDATHAQGVSKRAKRAYSLYYCYDYSCAVVVCPSVRPLQVVIRFLIGASPKRACGRVGFIIMSLCMLAIVHSKPRSTNNSSRPTTVGACATQPLW